MARIGLGRPFMLALLFVAPQRTRVAISPGGKPSA